LKKTKGVSGLLGGAILLTITLTALTSLALSYKASVDSLGGKASYYEASVARKALEETLRVVKSESDLKVVGVDPEDVAYVYYISPSGNSLILEITELSMGAHEVSIPLGVLEGAGEIYLITKRGVAVNLSRLLESPAGVSSSDAKTQLFLSILSRALNASDAYALLEGLTSDFKVSVANFKLPVFLLLRAENTSYILQTTSEGCPEGYVRVLYWGARTDYNATVLLGDATLYSERGRLEFIYTGSGTRSTSKTFPVSMGETTVKVEGEKLSLRVLATLYVQLTARSPSPLGYCATAFYYSQPTVGFDATLNLTLSLSSGEAIASIVPGAPAIWTSKPSTYGQTTTLYGHAASSDSMYIYTDKSLVLGVYSHVFGTGYGSGEVASIYPQVRLSFASRS